LREGIIWLEFRKSKLDQSRPTSTLHSRTRLINTDHDKLGPLLAEKETVRHLRATENRLVSPFVTAVSSPLVHRDFLLLALTTDFTAFAPNDKQLACKNLGKE